MTKQHYYKTEPFYNRYRHIRERCVYEWSKDYKRYGGAGITFGWKNYRDFKSDMYTSYLEHVKMHGYKNTSLDRIDGTKGYSKENCRWATAHVQHRNTKKNRYITYEGKTMIIADWAREIGTSRQTIRSRIEAGWTDEQIVKTPVDYSNRISKKTL